MITQDRPDNYFDQRLASFVEHRPELHRGPGQPDSRDLFTRSLRDDFASGLANLIKYPAQNYVGISGPTAASPDLFTNITTNICAVKPKIMLHAGRVVDFGS